MASWMSQIFTKSVIISNKKHVPLCTVVRNSSVTKQRRVKNGTIKHRNLISSTAQSLAARGFLRSVKPYEPPHNAAAKVREICRRFLTNDRTAEDELTKEEKFNILNTCFKELNYSVPNSLLHKINNVNEVIKFYEMPVVTTVPYDEMCKQSDLPPNLHIQKDYLRFHPETDTRFKGVSAFPQSSTIVTGLRSKKKYKGYTAQTPHEYYNHANFKKTDAYE